MGDCQNAVIITLQIQYEKKKERRTLTCSPTPVFETRLPAKSIAISSNGTSLLSGSFSFCSSTTVVLARAIAGDVGSDGTPPTAVLISCGLAVVDERRYLAALAPLSLVLLLVLLSCSSCVGLRARVVCVGVRGMTESFSSSSFSWVCDTKGSDAGGP